MELNYIVKKSDLSIKQILKNEFYMSEKFIIKLKRNMCIFVNNVSVNIDFPVVEHDCLTIKENFVESSSGIIPNSSIPVNILFEDEFLLILDKPAGIAIHPSMLHYDNSLSNGVQYYYNSIGLRKKIRPVNRLDKDTSGIVIFAKNEYIQECLIRQMSKDLFIKKYIAILDGILEKKSGTIKAPISRKSDSIIERCVSQNGDMAITHYKVLAEFKNYSEVEFQLETGRTHQIRVHSKYINHPILGDSLYGNSSNLINRQALHAYYISFIHPITKQVKEIFCELPQDMKKLL